MSASGRDHEALRARLDAVARRGASHLRRARFRDAVARALATALPFLPLGPAAILVGRLAAWLAGIPLGIPSPGIALLVTLGPAAVAFLTDLACLASWSVPRAAAIGLHDAALRARDRLVAADAFLARSSRSGFMEAAVEDAEDVARRALEASLAPRPRTSGRRRRAWWGAVAAALLVAALVVPTAVRGLTAEVGETPVSDAFPSPARGAPDEAAPTGPTPRPPAEAAPRERPLAGTGEATESGAPTEDLPQEAKATEGRTGSGPGAGAQSTSGANDARGVPSNQGPAAATPKEPKRSPPSSRRPKPSEEPPPDTPPKDVGEESGTTAGRGASRGSSRNPVASDWSSKDQVTDEDEDPESEDEDVEDEDSDSEARGGMQPSLRDRKPPVSRDLSIGFGNQLDDDAAGRGGPSQPKKSRGTASLVLGVPIPDRVKGQRNPGRTKITQERVEPRREESDAIAAEARRARSDPAGHVASPVLEPWMRRVIRAYFLTRRAQDGTKEP